MTPTAKNTNAFLGPYVFELGHKLVAILLSCDPMYFDKLQICDPTHKFVTQLLKMLAFLWPCLSLGH